MGSWYDEVRKPGFNPPRWDFGPERTALHVHMGISVVLVWWSLAGLAQRQVLALFGA